MILKQQFAQGHEATQPQLKQLKPSQQEPSVADTKDSHQTDMKESESAEEQPSPEQTQPSTPTARRRKAAQEPTT